MSELAYAYIVLAVFGLGLLVGGWFSYWLGRSEELHKWATMRPHVWMFGNEHCTHCGKTMQECGIKIIDASQYLVAKP